ncbi:glycoside hydrolase family 45 protein [Ascoidea rubescens DSM 1968]|uniref:Cellulase n=1 Tax=Ascoidea rubescens DSM 1968 TaxID=1344418 RepID=A0A1D2VQW0_9ASCO|nr:glycoside hydrolase family 45 protein [Ascoidea rubescens DSM 1968]ODV63992.1 glycoside hydrolase family 45 protein [Ascoidea rubescens DSM 1968]
MLKLIVLAALAASLVKSEDCAKLYYQCGGINWTGPTCCENGYTCYSHNDYYHQCTYVGEFETYGNGVSTSEKSAVSEASVTSEVETTTVIKDTAVTIIKTVTSESAIDVESTSSEEYGTFETKTSSTKTSSTESRTLVTSTTSTKSTAKSTPTSSGEETFQVISSGEKGQGTTTRYWDCCKPSCAWNGKADVKKPVEACSADGNNVIGVDVQSGCVGGSAYMCNDQQPWAISDSLAYGFAAAGLNGGSESSMCCSCYKLTFTSSSIAGKTMVVQVTNTGSDLDYGKNQFDIALPGGGMGIFSGCPNQFGSGFSWGQQYGGISSQSECAGLPESLESGCDFRFDWFEGADNPSVDFERVVCPAELVAKSGCSRNDE